MGDGHKTKVQLIQELSELRKQLLYLEPANSKDSLATAKATILQDKTQDEHYNLFESVPVGLCITNSDGDVLRLNNSFTVITGYTIEALSKIGIAGIYKNRDDRDKFLSSFKQHGIVENFEVRLLRSNNLPFWGNLSSSPIVFQNKSVILTSVLDITEHKITNNKQNAMLRFLENTSKINDVILEANNLEQMMSDVLQTSLEMFNTDRAWLLYPCDPDAEFWSVPIERTRPEYPGALALGKDQPMLAEISRTFRNALEKNSVITIDSKLPDSPQVTNKLFSTLSEMHIAIRPKTGKPWMFGLHQCSEHRVWTEEEKNLFHEISRRLTDALTAKLFLRDLKVSEEKWRSFTINSPDHVMLLDLEGTIQYINHTVPDLTIEEVIGKTIYDFTPPSFHKNTLECLNSVIESKKCESYQTNYITPESIEHYFNVRIAPILRDNKVVSFISVSHNITSRVNMERALRDSEKRFRTLFEANRDGCIIILGNGEIIDANPRMLEMLGYSLDELKNVSFWNITPNKWKKTERDVERKLLNERGYTNLYEKEYIHKDGSVFPIEIQAYTLEKGKDFNSTRIGAFVRDVSERKHLQEKLNSVLSYAPLHVWAFDGEHYLYLNEGWYNYTGQERIANPTIDVWTDCVHPEDLDSAVQAWLNGWKTKSALVTNFRLKSSTGDYSHFLCRAHPIHNDNGEFKYFIGYNVDVSNLKRAEAKQIQAFSFLQTVIDGFPDELMVINLDFTIALANKSLLEHFGLDSITPTMTCHQISHNSNTPCDSKEHQCPFPTILKSRKSCSFEHTHINSKGEKISSIITYAPIFDDKGEVVQIIESSRDISAVKKAEAEKLLLERQIQHAQKLESLGVLAGGIAHDFNNILMTILGNADLVLMDLSTANPVYSNVKAIEFAARRAADLSKQMLAYSGKGHFLIEEVNLNEAIDEMTHMLEVSISKKAVIKYHYCNSLPLIQADATQIRQIIMNLVTNASEAIEKTSGVISISTGVMDCDKNYLKSAYIDESLVEGQYIYLEVTDTGSGMTKETTESLFDPFFTTKFTGRGLGLSAVLGIIRGHEGTIKVYSEIGKGTSIKVLFPSSADQTQNMKDSIDESEFPQTGSGTILLVDDEESILSIGKQMLKRLGFNVLTAPDGKNAIAVFKKHKEEIVLVILDLTMPHLDGEEAFRELRRIQSDVQVLMSSGYNEQEITERFAGKSLAGFLQKPYIFSDLATCINKILK